MAARGEALVMQGDPARGIPACVACHGERLTGVAPAIPGLLGLPRDYLNAQFGAWRNGARRAHAPDCMAEIAGRLTVADVGAVSAWLASQPVPAGAKPAARPSTELPLLFDIFTTVASSTVSRIDCRCASRSTRSRCFRGPCSLTSGAGRCSPAG